MLNFLILNENMALADCRFLEWNGSNRYSKLCYAIRMKFTCNQVSGRNSRTPRIAPYVDGLNIRRNMRQAAQNSEAVNKALRAMLRFAEQTSSLTSH